MSATPDDTPTRAETGGEPRSPEEIREDIEQTREELGDTVEQLAEKTDVKAQARRRVDEARQNLRVRGQRFAGQARERTPSSAQEGGRQVATAIRANPVPVAVGAAALVAFAIGRASGRRAARGF